MMRFPRLFLRGHCAGGAVVCSPAQAVPCRGSFLISYGNSSYWPEAALCPHPLPWILTGWGKEERWT